MNKNIRLLFTGIRWLWNIDIDWWWCWLIGAVILFGLAAVGIALAWAVDGFIIPGIIPFLAGLLYLRFAWRSWRRHCREIAQAVLDRMNGKDGCEQYGIFINNTFKSRIK